MLLRKSKIVMILIYSLRSFYFWIILSIKIASLETEKVRSPNKGDNKATFTPPAIIAGSAAPLASRTSKAEINPKNAPITPKAKPKVPLSLICLSIFFETSLSVLIFKIDFTVKNIDINKQIRIRDINSAPPSKNLSNNVNPKAAVINFIIFWFSI